MKSMGGYRSHFELGIEPCVSGWIFEYEKRKVIRGQARTYTPDLFPGHRRVVEAKEVRQERPCEDAVVKEQNPDSDIRFFPERTEQDLQGQRPRMVLGLTVTVSNGQRVAYQRVV